MFDKNLQGRITWLLLASNCFRRPRMGVGNLWWFQDFFLVLVCLHVLLALLATAPAAAADDEEGYEDGNDAQSDLPSFATLSDAEVDEKALGFNS